MTLLIASIEVTGIDEMRAQCERAFEAGAEAVELRIDTYDGDPAPLASFLTAQSERTWIATCRGREEGGHFAGDTAERVSQILAVARNSNAYVDFELADWRRSDNIRQKIRLAAAAPNGGKSRLILSAHDFGGPLPGVRGIVDEIGAVKGGAIAKVAYQVEHINESFAALDLMHERADATTAIAMGEDGLWTRVVAKKLGAFATYCALDDDKTTAPGQITLDVMRNTFRWERINQATRVFGVIGDPIAHSMSPALFNRWFAEHDNNALYLPLRVRPTGGGVRAFLDECRKRDWLDIGGLSVTVPHKAAALAWAGHSADPQARAIGAVNTLSFADGNLRASNTDAPAAIASLLAALKCTENDLAGITVDVLGVGGAARALTHGLSALGCRITLFGRSVDKTKSLAEEFAALAADWDARSTRTGEIIINTTTVGMWPAVDESPLSADALSGCRLVFDLIYNPLESALLEQARNAGIAALNGLDMFVRQAAMQFEIWTGLKPDLCDAHTVLENEISLKNRK